MFKRHSLQSTQLEQEYFDKDKDLVEKFIEQQDLPLWFRGLSPFQSQAGHDLLNALRDDAEQHTTHRVRHCLLMIGLKPIPKSKDIRLIMYLSRGNDLAFLWFLLEHRYRTGSSEQYTTNEQIIMNVIAMLDMITTLRGLDEVLPPAQPTKKEIAQMKKRKKRKIARVQSQSEIDLMASKHHPKYKLPYFERLRHPIPYGKTLTCNRADHKLHFEFFENYANPNYVVPNEGNRWFAVGNDAFRNHAQNKRVVKSFINKELLSPTTGLVWQCGDDSCSRCAHHKIIDELELSLKHELTVIARNRCLGSCEKEREKEHARVRDEVEARAELHLQNFRRLANSTRNSMSTLCLLEKDGAVRFDLPECDDPPRGQRRRRPCEIIGDSKFRCSMCDLSPPKPDPARNCCYPRAECGDCLLYTPSDESTSKRRLISKKRTCEHDRNAQQHGTNPFTECVNRLDPHNYYDYGHSEKSQSPTSSMTYFNAALPSKPFQFDYRRIFYFKHVCGVDTLCQLRESYFDALQCGKCDINLLNTAFSSQLSMAVAKSTKRMFQQRLEKWNEEEDKREKENIRAIAMKQSYYDPDDKELMHRLLKEGLERLAQNPKYVLASMPDVHKHPMLKFWVYRRYGKVFSRKELTKEWKKTARIIRVLFDNTMHVDLPHISDIGRIPMSDYSCRNVLLKKSNYLRAKFYKQIDDALMDQARTLYIAMNPYLCSGGPPRNTFFSYMPPRRIDIQHFRVWKPNELMFTKTAADLSDCLRHSSM